MSLPAVAAAVAGDLLGSGVQGHFNAKMAREQMEFQERMRDTQYQAAAKDLQKAGLNRVLALGSPASAPSGASASIEAPKVGTSGFNAYNASMLMKEQIAVQREQAALLREQQQKTRDEAEKVRAETPNVPIQGDYMRTQIEGLKAQIPGWQMIPQEKQAQINNLMAQLPKIVADTRLSNANASEAEFKKVLYERLKPHLDALLNWALPSPANSGKAAQSHIEKMKSGFDMLLDDIINLGPNMRNWGRRRAQER